MRPRGLFAFILIWAGQVISLLGSAMTWFAFMLWAWQMTGEATPFALVNLFAYLPTLLFSPVAGALVDRWNRKLVMLFSDLGAALATLLVLLLYLSGTLQLWHLYGVGVLAGLFTAFQFPAYSSAATLMLPPQHHARAQGLLGLAQAASGILAPLLAASLLGIIGPAGIMMIDLLTFLIALGLLLWVRIPALPRTEPQAQRANSLWDDSLFGFRYIFRRGGLVGLQAVYSLGNFCEGFGLALIGPMILAQTGNNEVLLGSVQSIGAMGGVLGGLLLSLWGGPRRRISGVLLGWALSNLLGLTLMGLGSGFLVWAIASFAFAFLTPIVEGSNQALWQAHVPVEAQGRVFGVRLLLSQFPIPVAMAVAGPLADHFLEPALQPGGALVPIFGRLVGAQPGAGMALLLVAVGLVGALVAFGAYAFPQLREFDHAEPEQRGLLTVPVEVPIGTTKRHGA